MTKTGQRVLVVDDDESVLRLIERLLITRGYVVATARSVPEAASLLELDHCDVALIDKNLPHISGLELAKVLHAQYPQTAIVLMTAFPDASVLQSAPLDGYLAKPFRRLDDVPAALQTALERHQRAAQIAQLKTQLSSVKEELLPGAASGPPPPKPSRPDQP